MPASGVSLAAIARSLDTPPELGGVLAELFEPLKGLGCSPRRVVNALREAGVGAGDRVLDLACGKGPVSILAARQLRCRVFGVDAYAPFVEAARRAAAVANVMSRCRFRVGDVRSYERGPQARYDAALMLNLWPAPRAARVLRRFVRRGGVYIIDDAFLDERGAAADFDSSLPGLEDIRSAIENAGDQIEREIVPARRDVVRQNRVLYAALERSARGLAREQSALRPLLQRFLEQQRASNRLLAGVLRPAMWVVRRN